MRISISRAGSDPEQHEGFDHNLKVVRMLKSDDDNTVVSATVQWVADLGGNDVLLVLKPEEAQQLGSDLFHAGQMCLDSIGAKASG